MKLKFALLLGLFTLASCHGRPRSGALVESREDDDLTLPGKVGVFDLSDGVPEASSGGLFPLPANRTYVGLVRALERAATEGAHTSYFVRLGTTQLGFAQSEEISRLLADLKKRGKPVVCHAHSLSNSGVLLAARGCSRIWLSPAGDADTVGIAAQVVYLKGALDKLDVRADFLQMGMYKSAAEPLTREGPSDEARESLTELLKSVRRDWFEAVRQARPAAAEPSVLEGGPWSAEAAKAKGLVDSIGYESEALKEAKQRGNAGQSPVLFGKESGASSGFDIGELVRIIAGADDAGSGRPHIAVVPAEGAIAMESGGMFESGGITASALSKTLRRLARDSSVKAVVLRIDSPGGSALASDLLWHELMELRKKKPVVASVGNMAASGGYYLACAANRIVAESTSIVGSIGVVGGKFVFGPALEQVGVNTVTFAASDAPGAEARAAYMSALTPWDDATRAQVRQQMASIYELFLERVASGRKTTKEVIRQHAEGRIWSGAHGKERNLVDELGGLRRAIEIARQLSDLDPSAAVVVEGGADSLLETLLMGEGASTEALEHALLEHVSKRTKLLELVPAAARPYASAAASLAAGEQVLSVLPFVLTVQ